jgi:hypothetical protein
MTTPYPADNDRDRTADVDPLDRTADLDAPDRTTDADPLDRAAGTDPLDRTAGTDALDRPADFDRTADAGRPEYSGDQAGDDRSPLDAVTEPVTYPADADRVGSDHVNDDRGDFDGVNTDSVDAAPADTGAAASAPVDAAPTTHAPTTPTTSEPAGDEPLVPTSEAVDFKARWDVVQQGFVDDPRTAVTDADKLVSDVLARLSATFDEQHRDLEGQWSDGEPSTEDLRSALQKYRAFFQRLLTI